jgi:hypothetical protein
MMLVIDPDGPKVSGRCAQALLARLRFYAGEQNLVLDDAICLFVAGSLRVAVDVGGAIGVAGRCRRVDRIDGGLMSACGTKRTWDRVSCL